MCQQINRSNTITHTKHPQFKRGGGGGSFKNALKALELALEFVAIFFFFFNRWQMELQQSRKLK